jgi:uncharacterized membrane protein YGL010W
MSVEARLDKIYALLAFSDDRELALNRALQKRLVYYKSQHRTVGCKVTHMVGIPMLTASVFIFPFSRRWFFGLQFVGWMLQLIGHYGYEHNKPVLWDKPGPLTVVSALEFVKEEWEKFFAGETL